MSASGETLVGQVLAGRYTVVERIGAGGMGVVYRAQHLLLHKDVAIKVLHPSLVPLRSEIERFRREARAAASINSPHIASVTDSGIAPGGQPFFVMEYLRGQSLRGLLAGGPLDVATAVRLIGQALDALEEAHARGIVHRDLKPENIFVCEPHETVKLLDFGVAKLIQPGAGVDGGALTVQGMRLGTPQYMAPEQARAGDEVGPAADIYGLGVVLYEMTTGTLPFDDQSVAALLALHERAAPDAPSVRQPDLGLPAWLDAVVLRALSKDPRTRYSSAAEMKAALGAAAGLEPGRSRPQANWLLLVLGAILLVALGGVAVMGLRSDEDGPALVPPASLKAAREAGAAAARATAAAARATAAARRVPDSGPSTAERPSRTSAEPPALGSQGRGHATDGGRGRGWTAPAARPPRPAPAPAEPAGTGSDFPPELDRNPYRKRGLSPAPPESSRSQ